MLPDFAPPSIRVGNTDIPFVTHARNLRITISSNTTMDKHVTNICRSTYAELQCISSICHLLTVNATKTLLSVSVLSKLDYCNSLFCGSPQFILDKLQRVQNSAARLVMKSRKCDQVQPFFAQPSLVFSPLMDWLQDFNPVLQHFHQLFSCLYRSASIRLHPFQTPPFILGHTHPPYSFRQN